MSLASVAAERRAEETSAILEAGVSLASVAAERRAEETSAILEAGVSLASVAAERRAEGVAAAVAGEQEYEPPLAERLLATQIAGRA